MDAPGSGNVLSIIVPVYNESQSLEPLFEEISAAANPTGGAWEVLFVDDGSTDGSRDVLQALAARADNVRVIEFRRNFGKAAALDAGMRAAAGQIVITMDADLQDDPAEIPRFIEKLREGFDVVSGWKQVRNDPIDKTMPSRLFNWVVGRVGGLRLHDFNCGFKAYTVDAVNSLHLYGEMHRFIPVILHWQGFAVTEIPVNHRARQFGRSKYGAGRLIKGFLDLLTVVLNTRFAVRPLHVFGTAGMVMILLGTLFLGYLTVLWLLGLGPIGTRPLLFLGILLVVAGMQVMTVGLLGEYVQARSGGASYSIRRTINFATEEGSETAETVIPIDRSAAGDGG